MTDKLKGDIETVEGPAAENNLHGGEFSRDDLRRRPIYPRIRTQKGRKGSKGRGYRLNIVLFVLTVITTLFAGASFYVGLWDILKEPAKLLLGVPFSISILSILLAHEMGHYITSRRNRVDVSLPYFIPAPTLFGTLGAVIKMRSPIAKKNTLFDIGAAGPIAGLVVAIPVVVLGLAKSKFVDIPAGGSDEIGLIFGDSILFSVISKAVLGKTPEGQYIWLHPIGFAGWVGFLVTALNLMPIGQLDGGHIAYAVFGRRQRYVARGFLLVLIFMGVVFYPGWLIWAILLILIGIDHPPIMDGDIPLDKKRVAVGILTFLIFILTFIPNPVRMDM
ncbi:MAG: site-2 protease family protein [Deltaproteobacteria bacterium]|uniref:Site-2 protease family protein n=1 Tax=Candidatus Zymogenus saltonus TaxID=2844893 RepID=A0A9D8KD97_9DELT|nr:site-2 protease family protein [Candidatus Zymogenus saltonus]